ncbi:hypothetical protein SODALDRAFT_360708 [Sodiomyces alkalinus F11]|uniref:Uncharacterized protein n=1 Tax=Sodiomyces alkalinus (strain CBS 110278 / VKM F-3762 / F11) TaxID=1314773 RepID=A0A3N2PV09_SODAK|nr:hypothetical protein SODALDRAFT_360708 [Sodiomyces alkalinus F11]ROT38342.1 hypothetical protein SODALDRAFT_360708 [Sodiomyces alkalinus F11]
MPGHLFVIATKDRTRERKKIKVLYLWQFNVPPVQRVILLRVAQRLYSTHDDQLHYLGSEAKLFKRRTFGPLGWLTIDGMVTRGIDASSHYKCSYGPVHLKHIWRSNFGTDEVYTKYNPPAMHVYQLLGIVINRPANPNNTRASSTIYAVAFENRASRTSSTLSIVSYTTMHS